MPKVKLTKLQKDTLKFIGANSFGKNFYWTGGTLLSYYYLHHRDSVDLDFFSDDLFADDQYLLFINGLKQTIKADKITVTLQHNRRMYLINRRQETVKLELVFFPFAPVSKRAVLSEFTLASDSLTDIMVNKILATYQRNEPKDIYDLYCYLSDKPKNNLATLIKLVEKKFGVAIEPVLLLAKVNELAGSLDSLQPLLFKKQESLAKEVKSFFQKIFNLMVRL